MNKKYVEIILKLIIISKKYIDYRMAFGGAVVMGLIVLVINYYGTENLKGAITAALKQGSYTFFFGGAIMKGCEKLSVKIGRKSFALVTAIFIPSAIAIGLTFGIHNLKGTPKPIASTIPTAILVIPSTAIWGYRKRRQINGSAVLQENCK